MCGALGCALFDLRVSLGHSPGATVNLRPHFRLALLDSPLADCRQVGFKWQPVHHSWKDGTPVPLHTVSRPCVRPEGHHAGCGQPCGQVIPHSKGWHRIHLQGLGGQHVSSIILLGFCSTILVCAWLNAALVRFDHCTQPLPCAMMHLKLSARM